MSVGVRVLRGPDWDQDEADGGEGHVGTVAEVQEAEGTAEVVWDNGNVTTCRAGKDGKYDLRIYDNAATGVRHIGVVCDSCQRSPIRGLRWKCKVCNDFDLCSDCYSLNVDDIGHAYDRFTRSRIDKVRVGPREGSKRIQLHGAFRGAKVTQGRDWNDDVVGPQATGIVVEQVPLDGELSKNGVRVFWSNGRSVLHRLGQHGKMDIRCTEATAGPFCYPDHLPAFTVGSNPGPDVEKIEVGDLVRIGVDLDIFKEIQNQANGWQDDMVMCLGKTGQVEKVAENGELEVRFETKTYTLSPVAVAKGRSEDVLLEKGSSVQIISNEKRVRELQESTLGWNVKMTEVLGRSGRLIEIDENGHYTVDFGRGNIWKFHRDCCRAACIPDVMPGGVEEEMENLTPQQVLMLSAMLSTAMMQRDERARASPRAKTSVDMEKDTPLMALFRAIRGGHTGSVTQMVEKDPELVSKTADDGSTALHIAAYAGHEAILRLLVDKGADVNKGDETGDTPLLQAIDGQDEDAVEVLLDLGADVNKADQNGVTPLHKALQEKLGDIFQLLLKAGADVNKRDCNGDTPLFKALEKGETEQEILDALLSSSSLDLEAVNRKGSMAIHLAALRNTRALEKLLEIDPAMIKARQRDDDALPLHLAAMSENVESLKLLLKAGAEVDAKDRNGITALNAAASRSLIDSIMLLVEHGANVNTQDTDGDTPLHNCLNLLKMGRRDETGQMMVQQTVAYLVSQGARRDISNNKGQRFIDLTTA